MFSLRRKLPSRARFLKSQNDQEPRTSSHKTSSSHKTYSSYETEESISDADDEHGCISGSGGQINQLDSLDDDVESDGEDCELHIYEKRLDTRGEEVFLRVGTKSKIELDRKKSHRAGLVLTRIFDERRDLEKVVLDVQSKHVIKALQKVIGSYPFEDFNSKSVSLTEPLACIFHYRKELEIYAEQSDDEQVKSHVSLCLQYVEKTQRRQIKLYDESLATDFANFAVGYPDLWLAYKPGCLIYEKVDGVEVVSRLKDFTPLCFHVPISDNEHAWELRLERLEYDGADFGHVCHSVVIKKYEGNRQVRQLAAFPLQFHVDQGRIRRDLIERGKKYVSLCGIQCRLYDGMARLNNSYGPEKWAQTNVHDRIMLDTSAFVSFVGSDGVDFVPDRPIFRAGDDALERLTEEDFVTCHHELRGYSLKSRRWGFFNIARVQDPAFNREAFNHLVIPEDRKKLIASLVTQKGAASDDFDDHIEGKGKGLVFLLHGPPGVGKTFTAESIAEHTGRPLLSIGSGDIFHPFSLEQRLSELLALATRWNAVALLDEADVFLQARDLDSVVRNGLVSTLLRVLEYFEGIIFLTTNRIQAIDHAVQSRIHLAIAYPPLLPDVRRQIWHDWIAKACSEQDYGWVTQFILDDLMEKDVNGREIKNIMRIAHCLARSEGRDIRHSDIEQGLRGRKEFQIEFKAS